MPDIDGATGISYTPTSSDVGKRIRYRERAIGPGGTSEWAFSEWSEPVEPAPEALGIVAMYYPGWSRWDTNGAGDAVIADLNWSAFNHIIDFSVSPHNGELIHIPTGQTSSHWVPDWDTGSGPIATNWWTPAGAEALTDAAHSNGRKALLCIGSAATSFSFNQNLSTSQDRADLAEQVADAMVTYGYDGVNLDGEPGASITNYRAFWQAVVSEFASRGWRNGDASHKSISLTAISGEVTLMRNAIVDGLDFVAPMTYTPHEQTVSRHISPLTGPVQGWDGVIDDLMTGGSNPITDPAKILPGFSFYTYRWGGVTGPNQTDAVTNWVTQVNDPDGDIDRNWVDIWVACGNAMPTDSTATWYAGPDMHGKVIGGKWHSFESDKSIQSKAAFVDSNGLGGVVIWMYQHGVINPTTHPLAASVATHFADLIG